MKISKVNIRFGLLLAIYFIVSNGFFAIAQEHVLLFPDRSSCVSGDTIWFHLKIVHDSDS